MTTFHLPFLPPEALSDERSIAAAARRAIALAKGGDARAGLNLALQARRCAQGLELGRNRVAAGDLEAARAACTEALEVAGDTRPSRKIGLACEALAGIDELAANPVGARFWRERAADEIAQFEIARLQTRRQLLEVLAQGR